jgi:anti-anti-sigma factor
MKTADAQNRSDSLDPPRFSLAEGPLQSRGCVLTIGGELDIATTPELRARVNAIIERGVRLLVVDLRTVSFMDSTALAVFIRAQRRLGGDGRLALVIEPGSYVRLILDVAGLSRGLDVVETFEAAIQHRSA